MLFLSKGIFQINIDLLLDGFTATSDVARTEVEVSVVLVVSTDLRTVVQVWSTVGPLTVSVSGVRVAVVVVVVGEVRVEVQVSSLLSVLTIGEIRLVAVVVVGETKVTVKVTVKVLSSGTGCLVLVIVIKVSSVTTTVDTTFLGVTSAADSAGLASQGREPELIITRYDFGVELANLVGSCF
jgi:hypothetical protein